MVNIQTININTTHIKIKMRTYLMFSCQTNILHRAILQEHMTDSKLKIQGKNMLFHLKYFIHCLQLCRMQYLNFVTRNVNIAHFSFSSFPAFVSVCCSCFESVKINTPYRKINRPGINIFKAFVIRAPDECF